MSVTIYHNSRCSTCRNTLALLTEKGINPTIVDYLDSPPSAKIIAKLQKMLGFESPRQMMRAKETIYKELDLDNANNEQLIQALLEHPVLLERPIVVVGEKAAIGRPPENILAIL